MPSRDKSLLFPPFAETITKLEYLLLTHGLPFNLFMGLRTWEEQDALYAQGRERNKPGKIVTKARGGFSWHNYGFAADFVLDGQIEKPGLQWSWDTKADLNRDGRNDWMQLGELAKSLGLIWGGDFQSFPDLPHVENRYGLNLAKCQELYRLGGLKRVWEAAAA